MTFSTRRTKQMFKRLVPLNLTAKLQSQCSLSRAPKKQTKKLLFDLLTSSTCWAGQTLSQKSQSTKPFTFSSPDGHSCGHVNNYRVLLQIFFFKAIIAQANSRCAEVVQLPVSVAFPSALNKIYQCAAPASVARFDCCLHS